MRIGDLAARTKVSVRSLRYYEQQGLLVSTRSYGGQRHYTEQEVERVEYIQRMFAAGLSSQTIAETLPCMEAPSSENSDAAFARLVEERDKLSTHIEQLTGTRDSLDELIAANRRHRAQVAGVTS
jgi:DNA-binding transcriptional MerR regulator